jgi:hypothetical protein
VFPGARASSSASVKEGPWKSGQLSVPVPVPMCGVDSRPQEEAESVNLLCV